MADFTRERTFKTGEPLLKVAGTLPPGVYTFQLTVADDSGNRSRAAQLKVEVVRRQVVPVTPVTPVRPVRPVLPVDGRVIINNPLNPVNR
ncbi:hypothetical protein ACHHRT_01140 [Desulfurivibrio sp. D14AmB]|uniref:hypothetical protein n=1 Tax=Desulfurivibrio sp. D14AmB TaxID=3374370 RepID=UPI00376EB7AE